MKRRTRVTLSALFAVSVLGLSGCGSDPVAEQPAQGATTTQAGTAPQPAAPPATPAPPADAPGGPAQEEAKKEGPGARPTETARLAYEKTAEARSAKVTMMMEISGLSQGEETAQTASGRGWTASWTSRGISRFSAWPSPCSAP